MAQAPKSVRVDFTQSANAFQYQSFTNRELIKEVWRGENTTPLATEISERLELLEDYIDEFEKEHVPIDEIDEYLDNVKLDFRDVVINKVEKELKAEALGDNGIPADVMDTLSKARSAYKKKKDVKVLLKAIKESLDLLEEADDAILDIIEEFGAIDEVDGFSKY